MSDEKEDNLAKVYAARNLFIMNDRDLYEKFREVISKHRSFDGFTDEEKIILESGAGIMRLIIKGEI